MLRSRRTVRMRLTALYCVLFVLSAVALLAITNGVGSPTRGRRAVLQSVRRPDAAGSRGHLTSTCSAR